MSRAPLPAWRRLFAAGGAPAASHAALSRAPAPDRLLEPMRRIGIAHETSLDALARPLDVSGVLARVVNAALATERDIPVPGDMTGPRQHAGQSLAEETKPSRAPLAGASLPGAAPGAAPTDPAVPARSDARRRRVRPSRRPVMRTPPERRNETIDEHRAPAGGGSRGVAARDVASSAWRKDRPEVGAGAHARVLVDAPVLDVERLLAIGNPAGEPSRRARGPAAPTVPASERSASDAAALLVGAVERASDRAGTAAAAMRLDARRARARGDIASRATGVLAVRRAGALADAPEPGGGFRGLARRTLGAADGGPHVPEPLEPEARTASEIPLDTLDSRVAESLSRILEREARRHGIDLAEARA